jgi:formate dehydrogenase major subunit
VRKALEPPGEAREDIFILRDLAKRMGYEWKATSAQEVWDELRSLSTWHAGMSYERLEALGGIPWPCFDEQSSGSQFLHGRLWADPVGGPLAPFQAVEYSPPVDLITDEFPLRLTTGRRLDSFNTGVQTSGYSSPLRFGETIDLSPEDAAGLDLAEGERVRIVSRRGCVIAPVRLDTGLKPGLAFMTFHFPDQVATNVITIDATDPKSGTAEFKAAAIRVEKLVASDVIADEVVGVGTA